MSSQFVFPKPRDWEAFEDIVHDVFSRKYSTYNLQRYGRRGQKQYGVDICGPVPQGVFGIQCKHHPNSSITIKEIDEEIAKAETFSPPLNEYVITTSADRDTIPHSYLLEVSERREKQGQFPVRIMFWDDIYDWLSDYPDLLYKHFIKHFPLRDLVDLRFPGLNEGNKDTLTWPVTTDDLTTSIEGNLHAVPKVTPYTVTLGISTFSSTSYAGVADLEVSLEQFFTGETPPAENFKQMAVELNCLKEMLSTSFFSQELHVHLQVRLAAAFLFGWVYRRVSHFDLKLIFQDQVWATSGLPSIPSRLVEPLPQIWNSNSNEVVLVLNISRNISSSVEEYVQAWEQPPKALIAYSVEGNHIVSAAHALSVAREVSWKIKNLFDVSRVRHIHLFGALPAALATLISYHLNAIQPITLYFLQEDRITYQVGGVLQNNL
jgi:hypothetical protein